MCTHARLHAELGRIRAKFAEFQGDGSGAGRPPKSVADAPHDDFHPGDTQTPAGAVPAAVPEKTKRKKMTAINRLDAQARALIETVKTSDVPPLGAKVLIWERLASKLVFAPDPEIAPGGSSR